MATLFTLQKGAHYADGIRTSFLLGNTRLVFKAKFYPNCIYDDPQVPGQINKLFGVSYGQHHNCSGRIGWRSVENRIEILAYVYVAPQDLQTQHLGWVEVQEWHSFQILRKGKLLSISMDDLPAAEFQVKSPLPFGYRLSPYFGGKMPAPHEMWIEVEITGMNGIGA